MTPIQRQSLSTDLATRYQTQRVGGAYNDKNIIESGVDALFANYQSVQFQTQNGFLTKVQQGISSFKNDGKDLSSFVQGLNTQKYITSFPS